MPRAQFVQVLKQEVARIDEAGTTKRHEVVIEGFTDDQAPRAKIGQKTYRVFNSNDYLGLRLRPEIKAADAAASETFGAGPGAVRFISGSLAIHRQLEQALAKFHGRDDALIISSAFSANLSVLFTLTKGQNKDALISDSVVVISDELNHRSIIDGIRLGNLQSEQKAIFKHLDAAHLREVLAGYVGKYQRALVVTDGIFSMLGEYQDLKALRQVVDEFDAQFPEGVWLIVDDCHGVAAFGPTGRGCEEVCGVQADILIGTMGKGFGADGGYVVANQTVIDYLRESAAPYIYSNNISPGTAGAAKASVELLDSADGKKLLAQLKENVTWFKAAMTKAGFKFSVDSSHSIQPWFIGDTQKTKALKAALFDAGFLVTNINYPVVPKGRDELRVQISAAHTRADLEAFVEAAQKAWKTV